MEQPTTMTITINGRRLTLREGMRASELKALAGIDRDRVIIARRPDGALQVVPDQRALPGPPVLDAPGFIYG